MLTETKKIMAAAVLGLATGYTARWLTGREYRIPIEPIALGDLTDDGVDDAIIRVKDFREKGKDTLLSVNGRYIIKVGSQYYITDLKEIHDTHQDVNGADSVSVIITDVDGDGKKDLVAEVRKAKRM